METKQCSKCKQTLPADANHFYRNKSRDDGFADWCKICHNATIKKGKSKKTPKPATRPATRKESNPVDMIASLSPTIKAKSEKVLEIDFTGYENILESIVSCAKEEVRDPDKQALFWLKQKVQNDDISFKMEVSA